MLISRKAFKKIKGFNTKLRIGEDIDFGRRAADAGNFRFILVPFGASVRRFRMDGYLKGSFAYLKIGFANIFNKTKQDKDFKLYGETVNKK